MDEQIIQNLSKLHSKGIAWGNVKPENVLIDREGNAWVTDFGRGHREGWVEWELAETVKGDLTVLEKIRKLFFLS